MGDRKPVYNKEPILIEYALQLNEYIHWVEHGNISYLAWSYSSSE